MLTVQELPDRATDTDTLQPRDDLTRLRVLVVDDHPAVRLGLLQLLDDQPDFVVVEAACSAEEARSLAEREPIDVAVVDYQLGSRSGLWLTRMLKELEPAPGVVMYSAYCDGPLAAACVVAGADGLVSKGGVGAELCHAVRAVARGYSRLPLVPPTLGRRDAPPAQRPRNRRSSACCSPGSSRRRSRPRSESPRAGSTRSRWAMLHKLEGLRPDPVGHEPLSSDDRAPPAPGC